jgi:predicted anti-sigma-YlaC factor YlaD
MKCEQVQEIFPELQEYPERYPEAQEHLASCSSCKTLFHIFEGLSDDTPVTIDPLKRNVNFINIQKKMRRHDRIVFSRRISSVAAVFLLAIVTIFNINQSTTISIADISDDVLYLQSESSVVPEMYIDQNAIIEYLVEYENIESIENLF